MFILICLVIIILNLLKTFFLPLLFQIYYCIPGHNSRISILVEIRDREHRQEYHTSYPTLTLCQMACLCQMIYKVYHLLKISLDNFSYDLYNRVQVQDSTPFSHELFLSWSIIFFALFYNLVSITSMPHNPLLTYD